MIASAYKASFYGADTRQTTRRAQSDASDAYAKLPTLKAPR